MKLIHWAIIFVIVIIPFSIIARNTIQKKTVVLQDETRINNVLDNATYDAVTQIVEVAEELGYGKNIPITRGVAMASIDRFFQSLAVNFNLPSSVESAKNYFGQYIPVVMIIGYDGIYVYSYDYSATEGYHYVLKPKIPYAYTDFDTGAIINFTLGNDLKIYIPSEDVYLDGYVGQISASDRVNYDSSITTARDAINLLPYLTTNLSYIIESYNTRASRNIAPSYLYANNVSQDYEYNGSDIKVDASEFHKIRRKTIIDIVLSILRKEVNEHETYANLIGVTYDFNVPAIDNQEWNNTINDISVLAFFQGMPIGTDSFYNNYSLGGARIVQAKYIYGTPDKKYHKHNCSRVIDASGEIDMSRVEGIFINAYDAHKAGYWACELCR